MCLFVSKFPILIVELMEHMGFSFYGPNDESNKSMIDFHTDHRWRVEQIIMRFAV